jgi:hypothetical protein
MTATLDMSLLEFNGFEDLSDDGLLEVDGGGSAISTNGQNVYLVVYGAGCFLIGTLDNPYYAAWGNVPGWGA